MTPSTSLPADEFRSRMLGLLDKGTAALRNNDQPAAAHEFALACELLFQRAAAATSAEQKLLLLQRARQLLVTVQNLRRQATPTSESASASTSVGPAPGKIQAASEGDSRPRTGITFADVAGLQQVKEVLHLRLIYPLRHPEKLARYGLRAGGGMLLYGPPGTGKTMIARAVAGELNLPFIGIKPSEVLSQWFGQSEAKLATLFEDARKHEEGAVLFVDEIDALGASRSQGDQSEASRRFLTQLLQEMDGLAGRSRGLFFLAATNQPWLLDEALMRPGRFDEKCYVPLPDLSARVEVLKLQLRGAQVDSGVDLQQFGQRTDGYSGADLMCLCERAKQIPFREAVLKGTDRPIGVTDFEQALASIKPSTSMAALRRYESYANG